MEGDVIYEKNDVREAWNRKVENQINEAEKKCTPFPISCQQRDGVWGIWLQAGDEFLLVDPIELTCSVFVDDMYCMLEYYNKEFDGKKPRGFFYVKTRCESHSYLWSLSHTILDFSGLRMFTFEEYLSKTKTAIEKLYEVWSKQEPVAYDSKSGIRLDGVELCKKQLDINAVLPSNHELKNELVQEEEFRFYPVKDEYYEDYAIGIGNREYKTTLSDWDNDLECIRHQLESYVFERETTLKLFFDTSETTVILKKRSVLDHIEESHGGCAYKYKDYVLVEVQPNEFVHKPVLKGYCNEKETIRTMYEGLLCHALRMPLEATSDIELPTKMVAYNKIKSPLIEAFLKGERFTDDAYSIRQVHVEHVLTICPDYGQLYTDEEGFSGCLDILYDKDGNPIQMDELVEWQWEINPIVVASETRSEYEKDWADYHKHGLELARQLREKLSIDFDLWYGAPWEDKSGTIKIPQLVI